MIVFSSWVNGINYYLGYWFFLVVVGIWEFLEVFILIRGKEIRRRIFGGVIWIIFF